MKVVSFNTLYINYEKKYNPGSSIIINYPNDNDRLLDILKIIIENINTDTIVCLQECSHNLLNILKNGIDLITYNLFSQEIDTDVFMVTIAPVNYSFKMENILKNKYEKIAHGYLVISNDNMRIINCHLIPKFAAKGNIYSFINETCSDKKCILAGDFNEKYKNIIKYLQDYTVPYFGPTYKKTKEFDQIVFNFKSIFDIKKIDTYSVSDHSAILIDFYNNF